MKRSAPPLHILAAAMSFRSPVNGLQYRGGRKQWGGRSYSDRPYNGGGRPQQFVTGDSHFSSVREANLRIRQGGGDGVPNPRPPPPRYNQPHQYRPPPRYNHNQPFRRPPPPFHQNQNQQFRQAPPFNRNQNQSFRPRPTKPLDYRNWEYAKTAPPANSEKFTVLSYNILADYLALNHRSKLYFHIPRHILDWKWRKRSILFELSLWSADIMCLQEVDRFQELEEVLKLRGYSGIWKRRTGTATDDGCAVFWRTSRLKLLYEEAIEFNTLGLRDNVAQICVLELMGQNNAANTSALPTSSTGSNKVVICNIHVLYNPKRGEIKLGQVRMLLDRAHAVSKTWNDAPVALCGDFNCTPKSPLYNFISEQKLDLSGIDRDKVSGQASAQIRSPTPYNFGHNPYPNPSTQSSDSLIQAPLMVNNKPDMQKQDNLDNSMENIPSIDGHSQPQCTRTLLDAADISCTVVQSRSVDSAVSVEDAKETQQNVSDDHKGGIGSAICVLVDTSKESSATFHGDGEFPVDRMNDEIHKSTPPLTSPHEDACTNRNEMEQRKKANSAASSNQELLCEYSQPSICTENTRTNNDNPEISRPESLRCLSSQPIVNDKNNDLSMVYQTNTLTASTSIYHVGDNQLEDVSPQELNDFFHLDGTAGEDESTFLSALHDMKDSLPNEFDYSSKEYAADPNDSELHSPSDAVMDDLSPVLDSEVIDVEKTTYDPSLWTPMETATATGNADCTFLEHPLKFKSAYAEVEDCSGLRDPNGEPLVTSHNRCFLGTVDYIWCSEGLQTIRVLAPIPRHVMQWTGGFPTKKWGSDHIALASELAFTKDTTDNSVQVQ